MIRITGGTFQMGSPVTDKSLPEYHADERPQRTVRVDDFSLSRFLVTAEDFCVFLNDVGDSGFGSFDRPGGSIENVDGAFRPKRWAERFPASDVNLIGARAYCSWLSRKTGLAFRLPDEAEWEYAARGSELRPWPWGDEPPAPERYTIRARIERRMQPFYDAYGISWASGRYHPELPTNPCPVGTFPKNATPEGVYDMMGYGLGQWCEWTTGGGAPRRPLWTDKAPVRGANSKPPDNPTYFEQGSHAGRSWTRLYLDEESKHALIRLAMD